MENFARRAAAPIFALSLFATAALLFAVQPMTGRMATPLLGGAPAVWNTTLVFFQAALLLGYLYAHVLNRVRGVAVQAVIHGLVLGVAFLALPLRISEALGPPSSDHPALWLLGVLTLSVGAPFAAIAATAPLLQAWLARTDRGDDPYYLYAASNMGSMAGLLAYPALIEPLYALPEQASLWRFGYVIAGLGVALSALIAFLLRAKTIPEPTPQTQPSWRKRLFWLAAAAIPSSLILGVTQHIATDIASAPFLWVVPLALYLLTFVIAFTRGAERFAPLVGVLQPVALAALVISFFIRGEILFALGANLACFFLSALVCHFALAASRPPAERLTEFYLWVALGGALGGGLTALAAPVLFDAIYEYPIALACVAFFLPHAARPWFKLDDVAAAAVFTMAALTFVLLLRRPIEVGLFAGGVGGAAALVAAAAPLRDDRLQRDQLFFLGASFIFALMITAALFFAERLIVEGAGEGANPVLVQPYAGILLAGAFVLLALVIQAMSRRGEAAGGLVTRIALGAAAATLAAFVALLLFFSDGVAAALNIPIFVGLAASALALLLNRGRAPIFAALVIAAFAIVFVRDRAGGSVATQERSFFGVLRVSEYVERRRNGEPFGPILRVLMHGTTIHGAQIPNVPEARTWPLTYYNPGTALGEAIVAGVAGRPTSSVALIGLGAGTTACLLRASDRLTIYEIDPAVISLATPPRNLFTYVRDCPASSNTRFVVGDARLRIQEAPPGAYDVIVIDAFSSDAVPAHLLTREAIASYLERVSARGIVVLHLSNRNLALVAEATRVARSLNAAYFWRVSARIEADDAAGSLGGLPASAMILARAPETLRALPLRSREWRTLPAPPGRPWSDAYINLPRAFWDSLSGEEARWQAAVSPTHKPDPTSPSP